MGEGQNKAQGKKSCDPGLQESELGPLRGSAWKNPVGYGPGRKGRSELVPKSHRNLHAEGGPNPLATQHKEPA